MENQSTSRNDNQIGAKKRNRNPWRSLNLRKVKLKQFLEHFLIRIKPTLHPNTFKDYSQVIKDHINPFIGLIKLKDLNPNHIQEFYSIKLENGTTPSRVRYIHAVLHRALNLAVRWGYIDRNPAKFVNKPKQPRKEMKSLSAEQVRIFLIKSRGSRYETLFCLAVTTGLRKGEILGLRWSDIDWGSRSLRLQRQLQRVHGEGLIFSKPKSRSGRRLIMLGPSTAQKLRDHKRRQHMEKQDAGKDWEALDLVFPESNGSPTKPRKINRHFKTILLEAGLPNIRFHDLRHTSATLMLQCGVHPKIVQERLGHSSIAITLDVYSHVLPVMQSEAAQKLDEFLN
jgi:integrase